MTVGFSRTRRELANRDERPEERESEREGRELGRVKWTSNKLDGCRCSHALGTRSRLFAHVSWGSQTLGGFAPVLHSRLFVVDVASTDAPPRSRLDVHLCQWTCEGPASLHLDRLPSHRRRRHWSGSVRPKCVARCADLVLCARTKISSADPLAMCGAPGTYKRWRERAFAYLRPNAMGHLVADNPYATILVFHVRRFSLGSLA